MSQPAGVSMTDSELRWKLMEYGFTNVGPVTNTTRNVLSKKLNSLSAATGAPNVAHQNHHHSAAANQSDEEEESGIGLDRDTSGLEESGTGGPLGSEPINGLKSKSDEEELQLAFFDIETSGLEMDCDVLQIAVKIGSSVFNEYMKPSKKIPWNVYFINYLSNRGGELYFREEILPAKPVRSVLEGLLKFLETFKNRCVFVAHNCPFDASRLIRIIKQESMENQFGSVIAGFTDTLAMFREKFPERRVKGSCTLTTLVTETLSLPIDGAHDANNDVLMLEKLALHHFTVQQLITKKISFAAILAQKNSKSW